MWSKWKKGGWRYYPPKNEWKGFGLKVLNKYDGGNNDIINKIESIPIVLDKNFIEMKREEKKERPQTSKLRAKFIFDNKAYAVKNKKSTTGLFYIDEEVRLKRIKEEEERKKFLKLKDEEIKKKEEERNEVIQHGDDTKVEELLMKMDKELNEMDN